MILVMKKIIIAIVILLVISLGIYFLYFYDSNNYMDYNGSKFSFKYPDTLVIQEPIAGYPSAWVKDANLPYHIIMLSNHLTKNVPDFRFEMDYFETVLSERVEILLAEELNFSGYKAYYLIYKNPDSSNKQADIFILDKNNDDQIIGIQFNFFEKYNQKVLNKFLKSFKII